MRVLIVGAGALGQVFGLWLAGGDARVTYLVRPGRGRWADGGVEVTRLRRWRRPDVRRLVPHGVVSRSGLAQHGAWDMVWLCVDSTALAGDWTNDLRDAIGTATVVTIGQGPHDLAILGRTWPTEQIVRVTPNVLAHQTPDVAYWLPPGASMRVSGEQARAHEVVGALRAGGVRASKERDPGAADIAAARMIPFIAALEGSGWSGLDSERAAAAAAANREAVAIVAALHGKRTPLAVPAWAGRFAMSALPRLAPFDIRRYLEDHFTKVGDQTRMMLDGWADEGTRRGLPVHNLVRLRNDLPATMPV